MPVKTHTCLTVACDVCGEKYTPDDYTPHFRDLAEARDCTRGEGWTVTADGKIYCAAEDIAHQAFLDALMPPEPVMQVPGQLGFDGSEEGR
ncbi:hypothetical protein [Streptomyces sp. NRRL S-813]|uniref:hypothetical protein n=1 Tax=Streptomyces sp. NRRL S-813 TaxID=1463919 RepID=UPI0004C1ABA2|nr:hypothetical protein [Streptomyces sp. NRRL S-813]